MSTKNSIFLTNENEHCYTDCVDYVDDEGGVALILEIDKKHADCQVSKPMASFSVRDDLHPNCPLKSGPITIKLEKE